MNTTEFDTKTELDANISFGIYRVGEGWLLGTWNSREAAQQICNGMNEMLHKKFKNAISYRVLEYPNE